MAKPMPINEHHPTCNCCGKQPPFMQIETKPSGFELIQSTLHTTFKSLESASVGVDRRKSLQQGNEANCETSLGITYNKLVCKGNTSEDLAAKIIEEIANRSMLQAKEYGVKGTLLDKESLLEECSNLKCALADQHYHLQLHKVHHESVHLKQRRIEIAIEELEMANGLEAPRTGGPSRLKSKLLGLKCRQQEYVSILTTLQDNFKTLKKDPQVSLTNGLMWQMDVFATEIRRLQKMVRQFRTFYHKICAKNKETLCLREDITNFTIKITNAQISLKDKETSIDQMKKDIDRAKSDAIQAQRLVKNAIYKAAELETHSAVLEDMLASEKQQGRNILSQSSALTEQTRNVLKENADTETAAKMAALAPVIAAAEAAALTAKRKRGRGEKMGKLKGSPHCSDQISASMRFEDMNSDRDDSNSATSKDGTGDTCGKGEQADKSIDIAYLKEIELPATKFIESAPASRPGSPKSKGGQIPGTPNGDHSEYELIQTMFEQDISDGEDRYSAAMDGLENGAPRHKRNAREEAKRLDAELEALKKASSSQGSIQNKTIPLDDEVLLPHQYVIDMQDSRTNVWITSPNNNPEASAKTNTEDEARKLREEEEARRRAQEVEEQKKAAAQDDDEDKKKRAAAKAASKSQGRNWGRKLLEAGRRGSEEEEMQGVISTRKTEPKAVWSNFKILQSLSSIWKPKLNKTILFYFSHMKSQGLLKVV